ncbi:MAG: hypothetical protein NTX53_04455 [candidate division WOR-3 bacterium]|nr:hypothetical protein [candidate division WOR-3 bacterium]
MHLSEQNESKFLNAFSTNAVDMFSLGLAQLFATAKLLGRMIAEDGSEEERARMDPVTMVSLWLLVGNALFLAIYVVAPGYAFAPLLRRMDEHYEAHRNRASRQTFPGLPE